MSWLNQAFKLSQNVAPFIIVTIANVKGHAPRNAGSKMLVSLKSIHGSIGGGNLEQVALDKARKMLQSELYQTDLLTIALNPKGGPYGVQCCGGEVSLLFEKVQVKRPSVAIFGAGHVGWALTHVLSIFPIDIYLIDSRETQLERDYLSESATLHKWHKSVPETALADLPLNSHVLVMTHDHAEDIAILDFALKTDWAFLGLIGSNVKWLQFQQELKKQGHDETALTRITTPIGLAEIKGKSPQVIALATAAQLLTMISFAENDI